MCARPALKTKPAAEAGLQNGRGEYTQYFFDITFNDHVAVYSIDWIAI